MTPTNRQHDQSAEALDNLNENGFCIATGCIPHSKIRTLSETYDRVVAKASAENVHTGRSSTRVNRLLKADPIFRGLYEREILLTAARQLIGAPFKLSCFHARSLRPHCDLGEFHIDFRPDEQPFPLLSFIYVIDEFTERNGATRFVPCSQIRDRAPAESDQHECREQSTPACGPAGSLIIFDGRIWHAHGANSSSLERRSLQGSFVPSSETSATEIDIPTFVWN